MPEGMTVVEAAAAADAQAATPEPSDQAAEATAEQAKDGDAGVTGEATDGADAKAEETVPKKDDPVTENRHLSAALKQMREQNRLLKGGAEKPAEAAKPAPANVPASDNPIAAPSAPEGEFKDGAEYHAKLKGLPYDPDDNTVFVRRANGKTDWIDADLALVKVAESEREAADQTREAEQRKAADDKFNADMDALYFATIGKEREKQMADLPKEDWKAADRSVNDHVADILDERKMVFDPDNESHANILESEIIPEAVKRAKRIFYRGQAEQARANADAASKAPVPASGAAAISGGKSPDEMTKAEKEQYWASAAERATAEASV